MMTHADNAAALGRSHDACSTEDAPATVEINHPSLAILRTHLAMCERCPVGAPCNTGDVLRRIWGEVKIRLAAAEHWRTAEESGTDVL